MRTVASAMKTYLSSFGLPAYSVDTVPRDQELPYITYPVVEPEWNQKASFYLQVWYRATNNTDPVEKADQIVADIGTCKNIPISGGYLVLYPETPLIQIMVDGDIRSAYINLSINAYHIPGI